MKDILDDTRMTIALTRAEALVLSDWLARVGKDGLPVEHHAETLTFWEIEAQLERSLSEPFAADYSEILARARSTVVERCEGPDGGPGGTDDPKARQPTGPGPKEVGQNVPCTTDLLHDLVLSFRKVGTSAEAEITRSRDDAQFHDGRAAAYREVLNSIKNRAISFDLPLDELGLEGFDPLQDPLALPRELDSAT